MILVYNPKKYNNFFLPSTVLKHNLLLKDKLKSFKKIDKKEEKKRKTSYIVYLSSK
jgi:hypothetical protein